MKKIFGVMFIFLISLTLVMAAKVEVSSVEDTYSPGENITLKVSLFDNNNIPIEDNVGLVMSDANNDESIEKVVVSNKFVDVNLGDNPASGYWKITANYEGVEATQLVMIETNEVASFSLDGDVLTIVNIGNVRYKNNIQIVIGETIGTKEINLGVGEDMNFRLIAPDGVYSVKVSDGKTVLNKGGVSLTGNVVGIVDENMEGGTSPITGVGRSEEEAGAFKNVFSFKNSMFVYVFLIVIFGAVVLLAIERRFRKRAGK